METKKMKNTVGLSDDLMAQGEDMSDSFNMGENLEIWR